MIDLLMLGLVPGTHIQINFVDWLLGTTTATCLLSCVLLIRHHAVLALTTKYLVRTIRRLLRRFKPLAQIYQIHLPNMLSR